MITNALVALLFIIAWIVVPAHAQMRFEGLDRLYFTRIAEPGDSLTHVDIARLLPSVLEKPEPMRKTPDRIEQDGRFTVRDIELRSRSDRRRIWIREVMRAEHPRFSEVWWALYDGGHRSDVWYFIPLPDRTDGKVLSNYHLDGISMPRKGVAMVRVRGEMFRPGGAWWIVGKELVFDLSDTSFALSRVRNAFGFFHSYERDSNDGVLSVSTERMAGGRYEIRTIDPLPEKSAGACGYSDPVLDDDGELSLSWTDLERIARCITSRRGAAITYRALDAESFIERPKSAEDGGGQ